MSSSQSSSNNSNNPTSNPSNSAKKSVSSNQANYSQSSLQFNMASTNSSNGGGGLNSNSSNINSLNNNSSSNNNNNNNSISTNNSSSSSSSNSQLDQVNEIMKRISLTMKAKMNSEAIYFVLCLLSTFTSYYSIYHLNVFIFRFRLFFYTLLVMSRQFVSRIIKAREASDPLKLKPLTPVLGIAHSLITLDIIYVFLRLVNEANSHFSVLLLLSYHLIYFKFGQKLTNNELQFGSNHDLAFYFKVMTMKLIEIVYFSFLLPMVFRDSDIPYDLSVGITLASITATNIILFYAMEIFINIGMFNKMQAKKLGCWKRISETQAKKSTIFEWKENQPYKRNIVVSYSNKFYQSIGKTNLAVPGSKKLTLFYMIFHKVQKSRRTLIIFSGFLMVLQDILILKTNLSVTFALSLSQTLIVAIFLITQNYKLSNDFN